MHYQLHVIRVISCPHPEYKYLLLPEKKAKKTVSEIMLRSDALIHWTHISWKSNEHECVHTMFLCPVKLSNCFPLQQEGKSGARVLQVCQDPVPGDTYIFPSPFYLHSHILSALCVAGSPHPFSWHLPIWFTPLRRGSLIRGDSVWCEGPFSLPGWSRVPAQNTHRNFYTLASVTHVLFLIFYCFVS